MLKLNNIDKAQVNAAIKYAKTGEDPGAPEGGTSTGPMTTGAGGEGEGGGSK